MVPYEFVDALLQMTVMKYKADATVGLARKFELFVDSVIIKAKSSSTIEWKMRLRQVNIKKKILPSVR